MGKLFLITGSDDFNIKDKAKEIVRSFSNGAPENDPDLEIIRGDSDELKPFEILSETLASLQIPSFLSAQKTVWLKHFQHFAKVFAKKVSKEDERVLAKLEEITTFIKNGIPEDIILIIDGPGIDKRKAFYKACNKGGDVYLFDKVDLASKNFAQEQSQRIKSFCNDENKRIDHNAVTYLIETLGSDSGKLKNELDKLICYVGDRDHITFSDCKEICSRTPEALSYSFANALIDRQTEKALDIVNILMEQIRVSRGGSSRPELPILATAVNSFQEVVKVKKAIADLNITGRVSKNYFYSVPPSVSENNPDNFLLKLHPYRAFMLCENAGKYQDKQLIHILKTLLKTNQMLVSGGANSRIALEQLVFQITQSK